MEWEKIFPSHISKDDIQMANNYMKRWSTLLIIIEMQVQTTVRYHFTPFSMTIIKKTRDNKYSQDVEKRELLYTVGGHVNWCSYYGTVWKFHKKLKIELYDITITLLGIYQKEAKSLPWRGNSTLIFTALPFTIAKIWNQPSIHWWISG